MTKPKHDGDDVTRQKMQEMVADPQIAANMNGPRSLSAESALPLGKPNFLSTNEYDLGRKILRGEAAPLVHLPAPSQREPAPPGPPPSVPRPAPLVPAPIDPEALPSSSMPRSQPEPGEEAAAPLPVSRPRGLLPALLLLLLVPLLGYGVWQLVLTLEPSDADDVVVSAPVPKTRPTVDAPVADSPELHSPTSDSPAAPTSDPPPGDAATTGAGVPEPTSTQANAPATASPPASVRPSASPAATAAAPSNTPPPTTGPGGLMFPPK